MKFDPIDRNVWSREPFFQHYFDHVPCTYSMTTKLDITAIRQSRAKLYPALLYAIASVVNRHEEFRTAIDERGRPGVFSELHPCYTIFHPQTETFSNLWTEFSPDYSVFLKRYVEDQALYGERWEMEAKPGTPANTFPVSMIPWTSFDGFNLNLQKGYDYLLPIFTLGKYDESDGICRIPLAVQVHHAVCDGFHLCRFLNELQELIRGQSWPAQA